MNKSLTIVKIGGKLIDSPDLLRQTLEAFSHIKSPKILVHGGGKKATEIALKLGVEPQFIDGRRVTDEATLDITTMVYAGLINKKIVSSLQQLSCNALGLSGADLDLIRCKRRESKPDFGWVGDVVSVNHKLLSTLINQNITPVFSAITHNNMGNLLNTNADTIACEIAKALSHLFDVKLVYCFEKSGVLQDVEKDNSVISLLKLEDYLYMKTAGMISEGMIPKLQNGFDALHSNVKNVVISNPDFLIDKNAVNTKLIL